MKLSYFQLCSTLLEAHVSVWVDSFSQVILAEFILWVFNVNYVVEDNRLICIKENDKMLNVSVGGLGQTSLVQTQTQNQSSSLACCWQVRVCP